MRPVLGGKPYGTLLLCARNSPRNPRVNRVEIPALRVYLERLSGDTVLHTEHGYRTPVSSEDVKHALRRSGRRLYT
ncbi:hypothetical protein C8R44DRAFT_795067 [Mycena epipterygia]|nr:hypothetical protein C8R44DRAFT_795067 [Mycena epipterygia]